MVVAENYSNKLVVEVMVRVVVGVVLCKEVVGVGVLYKVQGMEEVGEEKSM